MRSLNDIFHKQHGDTIVEVLIAIAVVSAVLGSAYAITNRTSKNHQQITEHTEALKIAESQLEALRGKAQTGEDVSTDPNYANFCINSSEQIRPGNDASCINPNPDNRYSVSVTRGDPDNNTFRAIVNWGGINGGTDNVSLAYKVYE